MTKNKRIYEKINEAVRLLCDVYDILNEPEEEKADVTQDRFLKISQFLQMYPEYTTGQIRHYIFTNKNGFSDKVTKKVGKSIFINEKKFFQWFNDEI